MEDDMRPREIRFDYLGRPKRGEVNMYDRGIPGANRPVMPKRVSSKPLARMSPSEFKVFMQDRPGVMDTASRAAGIARKMRADSIRNARMMRSVRGGGGLGLLGAAAGGAGYLLRKMMAKQQPKP